MKSSSEILQELKNSNTKKVKLAAVDIDGVLRGKIVSIEKFESIVSGGLGFCSVVFGWDLHDKNNEAIKVTGWHSGYEDFDAFIDTNTFRKIPWENDLPFFLADFSGNNLEKGLEVCPRTLLKKTTQKAEKMGFLPQFSQEFEWFNFETTPQQIKDNGFDNIKALTPGMFGYSILRSTLRQDFFNHIFDYCEKFDIPLEGLHTETGPGVYEAAIQYSDILLAADRATLFKTSIKEIAYKLGIMATFMAKWSEDLPGCGGHVHQSLWDLNKKQNLFADKKNQHGMSELMQQYVAGQLYCLPHITPMFAPTINSYKRLVEGAWAPTTLTWAVDNRTTALRVLSGSEKATRLETRVIGSDVNPYLAMSACLAAGLYGIENKLRLDIAPTDGNGYKDFKNGTIPTTLHQATANMRNSEIAKELFGATFVDHFCTTREFECKEFNNSVTDWEKRRYFEII